MSYYYIASDRFGRHDIAHYGVLGMKWGIRRYQNKDGSLTAEGKARAKTEYKADNKKAFELGREATIVGKALTKSEKKIKSASYKNIEQRIATNQKLQSKYNDIVKQIQDHRAELVNKYGKEAVKDIKYGKNGRIAERVLTGKQIAAMSASIPLSVAIGFMTGGTAGMLGFEHIANIVMPLLNLSSLSSAPVTSLTAYAGALAGGINKASKYSGYAKSKGSKLNKKYSKLSEKTAKQNFKKYGYSGNGNIYSEDYYKKSE